MDNSREQYNRGGMIAFVFSIVFCLLFFAYVSFIDDGVDLKEVPQDLAAPSASTMDVTKIEKPWIENEALVSHGRQIYKTNCASCHGESGAGDSPVAAAMTPPPRDFVVGKWTKGGTSAELYATLQNGIPGTSMASFKHLSKVDRWALVQFIRSITKNKVPDDAEKLESFAASAD